MVKIDIYFDGACRNVKDSQAEPFGYGVAVFIDGEYSESFSDCGGGGKGTSNISEWAGCVAAMRIAFDMHVLLSHAEEFKIEIFSDSQIITNQFNGAYQIKQPSFKSYYLRAKDISNQFNIKQKITWIPRTKNQQADILSKKGLLEVRQKMLNSITKQ